MKMKIKRKILVAMSGGVDSAIAAAILKDAGHQLGGATLRTWLPAGCPERETKACCGVSGLADARRAAEELGIPHWGFDFEAEFRELVIKPFTSEYMSGRTPNPCILCNEHVKFRLFLERARQLGFDDIATGHHARAGFDPERKSYYLEEGKDPAKDQSYVLFPLNQDVLAHLHLPVGDYSKSEIREMAKKRGLHVWDKPDSQEICFIPDDDYGAFLKRECLNGNPKPGVIRFSDGREIGKHDGFFHYTRGQRRGLGVPYRERLYVLETSASSNEVVVGTREETHRRFCWVDKINWFLRPKETNAVPAQVRIRSQHRKAPALLEIREGGKVRAVFEKPQDAITPGQAAVFYQGTRVIGGGWIDEVS